MGNQEQAWSASKFTLQKWEHWVVVFNQGTVKIYRNGNLDLSQPYNLVPSAHDCPLLIGRNTLDDLTYSEQFFGKLDEIRIYNRVLTQEEITYLANN
jgi:hypothetical protein